MRMRGEKNKMKQQRDRFSGKIGYVLAVAGSAVGLGNIWRFPYLAAKSDRSLPDIWKVKKVSSGRLDQCSDTDADRTVLQRDRRMGAEVFV